MDQQPEREPIWLVSARCRADNLVREVEGLFVAHLEFYNCHIEQRLVSVRCMPSDEEPNPEFRTALRIEVLVSMGRSSRLHQREWVKGRRPVNGRMFAAVLFLSDGRLFLLDYNGEESYEYNALQSQQCTRVLCQRLAVLAKG